MNYLNNEEMAVCQSGLDWGALTLSECTACFGSIITYETAMRIFGSTSFFPSGVDAIFAACVTPIIDGIAGATGMRASCPPCAQKIFAE